MIAGVPERPPTQYGRLLAPKLEFSGSKVGVFWLESWRFLAPKLEVSGSQNHCSCSSRGVGLYLRGCTPFGDVGSYKA